MLREKNRLPLWSLKIAVKMLGRSTGVPDELKSRISDLGCIFIHIPKCAGMTVQNSLFGEVVFGHQTIRQYQVALSKATYKSAWKFTITRDPFERIVSAWRFLKAGGYNPNDEKYFAKNLSQYPSFDHFVNDWLIHQDLNQCGCVHFKTQLHYIHDFNGEIALDQTIKLSDLADKYSEIRNRFGGGELIVRNKTKGKSIDFRSYYTNQETLMNIAKIYDDDIQVLGYSSRLDNMEESTE